MAQQETGKAESRCAVESARVLPSANAGLSRAKSDLPVGARVVDGLDAFHNQIGTHLDAVVSLHPCIGDIRRRLAVEVLSGKSGPKTDGWGFSQRASETSETSTSESANIGELIDIETARPTQRTLIEFRCWNGSCLIRRHVTDAEVKNLSRREGPVKV